MQMVVEISLGAGNHAVLNYFVWPDEKLPNMANVGKAGNHG